MVDFETIKTLGMALGSVKTITEIAGTITNTKLRQEMNDKIVSLQSTLLTARQQMLDMQEKYELLLQENKQLKEAATPKVKPRRKWGCYQFDDDDGLFCTACYDTKGQKIQTTRLNSNFRQCPACKAMLGSG